MTVKLEVGKKYVTRSGEVVGPMVIRWPSDIDGDRWGVVGSGMMWNDYGRYWNGNNDLRLIAEHHEPKEVGTLKEIGAQVGDVVEWWCDGFADGHYTVTMGIGECETFLDHAQLDGCMLVPFDRHDYVFKIISRAKPFQPQTCHLSHPVTLAEVTQPSLDDQIKAARKDVKRAKKRLRKLRKEKADAMCHTAFRQRPVFMGGDDGVNGGVEYWDNLLKQEGDAK